MIIYPTIKWNSFISLLEANELISKNIINTAKWDALTDEVKEKYLMQSTLLIKLKTTNISDKQTPHNIKLATIYLSTYSLDTDMLVNDNSGNLKMIEIDGAIKKEYFGKSASSNSFPIFVQMLLTDYGVGSANTLKLERS